MLIRTQDKIQLRKKSDNILSDFDIWGYDSRVNGSAHKTSDLANEKHEDSTIPILVELRDWANRPTSFHQQIETQRYVSYSKKTTLL